MSACSDVWWLCKEFLKCRIVSKQYHTELSVITMSRLLFFLKIFVQHMSMSKPNF